MGTLPGGDAAGSLKRPVDETCELAAAGSEQFPSKDGPDTKKAKIAPPSVKDVPMKGAEPEDAPASAYDRTSCWSHHTATTSSVNGPDAADQTSAPPAAADRDSAKPQPVPAEEPAAEKYGSSKPEHLPAQGLDPDIMVDGCGARNRNDVDKQSETTDTKPSSLTATWLMKEKQVLASPAPAAAMSSVPAVSGGGKTLQVGTSAAAASSSKAKPAASNANTGPLSYWDDFRSRAGDRGKFSSTNYDPRALDLKGKYNYCYAAAASGAASSSNAKVAAATGTSANAKGKALPFQLLTDGLTIIEDMIGSGKGSNKMKVVVLTNLFRTIMHLNPQELVPACYFLLSKVAADYENVEVGVGDALVFKAVATAFSSTPAAIQDLITRSEAQDVGEAALILKMKTRQIMTPARLTISKVFTEIRDKIAKVEGKNSQKTKLETMQKLIAATQRDEVKYLVRSFQAKLRVGINNATILTALAHAVVFAGVADRDDGGEITLSDADLDVRLQQFETAVKKAYCEMPNYEKIITALITPSDTGKEGCPGEMITPEKLGKVCKITPGIPLKPMLAKPSKGISEVLERLKDTKFTAEYKYDGERAQVHVYKTRSGKMEYRIYSRNSENMTQKYPDVIEIVKAHVAEGVTSLIVDAEIVAYEPATKTIQPFQKLSTRSKKNVQIEEIKVQVCLFVFDLIFLNGRPWTHKSLRERRDKMLSETVLQKKEGSLHFASGKDMELDEEQISNYLNEAVAASCEGLMLKTLDANATYEPSKRSLNWLKLKKDYMEGMADSVDIVPIGAWYGTGKRTGVFGSYLLACYHPDNDEYQTLCKAGTGYSDEVLKQHHDFFKDKTRHNPDGNIMWTESPNIKPDVWLEICQVWEIQAADLSISPVHCAAMGMAHPEKGIALRFPRFIRIRDDKNPEDATSAEQIKQMYDQQAVISSGGTVDGLGGHAAADDDFL